MSSYTEGQTHQLMEALERSGFSSGDITKLGQSPDLRRVRSFIRGEDTISFNPSRKGDILRLISSGQDLTVGPCDGTRTIANSSNVFTWGITGHFESWGTNVAGKPTGPTKASVCELVQDAMIRQMFNSLGIPLNQLCWEQHQIIDFTLRYRSSLKKKGHANFFLFKVGDEFFVAYVRLNMVEQPSAGVGRFSDDFLWRARYRPRVFLPQLSLKS